MALFVSRLYCLLSSTPDITNVMSEVQLKHPILVLSVLIRIFQFGSLEGEADISVSLDRVL